MTGAGQFLLLNEIASLLLMNVAHQRYFSFKFNIKTKITKASNFSCQSVNEAVLYEVNINFLNPNLVNNFNLKPSLNIAYSVILNF